MARLIAKDSLRPIPPKSCREVSRNSPNFSELFVSPTGHFPCLTAFDGDEHALSWPVLRYQQNITFQSFKIACDSFRAVGKVTILYCDGGNSRGTSGSGMSFPVLDITRT